MESARTFRSESREARFACITDSAGKVQSFAEKVNEQTYISGELEKEQESKAQDPKKVLHELYEKLQVKNTPQMRKLMEENLLSKIQEETLKYLMRLLGGRLQEECCGNNNSGAADVQVGLGLSAADMIPAGGRYLTEGVYTVSYESETTTFSTKGTVNTADGRSLEINVEAVMSREYMAYSGFTVRDSVSLIDPLVINLDGNPATVSDQKF